LRISRRSETWIHTHFLTDGRVLSSDQRRRIKNRLESFLRLEGIVFGLHFEEARGEEGLRIVLECIPLPQTLDRIQTRLEEEIRHIPIQKPVVKKVRVE